MIACEEHGRAGSRCWVNVWQWLAALKFREVNKTVRHGRRWGVGRLTGAAGGRATPGFCPPRPVRGGGERLS